MKKFLALSLVLVLTFALCACAMCAQPQVTTPAPTTTAPTTTATQPSSVVTMPTIDTNIPDPTVQDNSTTDSIVPNESDAGNDNGITGGDNNTAEPGTSVPSDQSRSRYRGY